MTKRISTENTFVGYEFLPAKPAFNTIEIYHPFADLANEYFSNKGLKITSLKSGSIIISFEHMSIEEKIEFSNEIKKIFKESRQKIIKDFLIYKKNGISYL